MYFALCIKRSQEKIVDISSLSWIQDWLVRTCVREAVREIKDALIILNQELHRYNCQQIHLNHIRRSLISDFKEF
jgi:hypothetical protein